MTQKTVRFGMARGSKSLCWN